MRNTSFWLGLVLAAALAPAVGAADPTDDDEDEPPPPATTSRSWWPRWMQFRPRTVKKEPEPKPAPKPAPVESPAVARARETADWLRRVAVCDRLHQIAADNNDGELAQQADRLEQKAWAIYQEHTATLPTVLRQMDLNRE